MPDSIPVMIGHRIIAWALGRSGQGPKMIASSLAQEASGGISVSGRPQSSGFAGRVQRTVLGECRKPAFARYLVPKHMGLRRELERYFERCSFERTRDGRLTKGRTPASVLGAAKMWR